MQKKKDKAVAEKEVIVMGEVVKLWEEHNTNKFFACECHDCSCDGDDVCPDCPSECGCDQ